MSKVTLGLVQSRAFSSKDESLRQHVALIRDAAARGAQIVCLQELFNTPYFCITQDTELFNLAEAVPGPTTDVLAPLAKELGVVIIVPLFEKRGPGLYHNTAAVIDADGTVLGKYRKMHIPQDPGFEEKFYFTPGDLGYRVWDTKFGRIGVLICWDQWYPEGARLMALAGADLLLIETMGRIDEARARLNGLLAQPEGAPLGPPRVDEPVSVGLPVEQLVARALVKSPEVAAASLMEQAAQSAVRAADIEGKVPSFSVGISAFLPVNDMPAGYGTSFAMSLPWVWGAGGKRVQGAKQRVAAERATVAASAVRPNSIRSPSTAGGLILTWLSSTPAGRCHHW